jgi:sulfur carrier protein ThiS
MIHVSVETVLTANTKMKGTIVLDSQEGYTVKDLMAEIHLDINEVGIILINSKCASSRDILHDYDDVKFIPVLVGG